MNASISRREFLGTAGAAVAGTVLMSNMPRGIAEGGKITMGFVGCAHIHTPSFVNLLKSRSDVRVKSVWDHDQARAAKRAGELGATTVADAKQIWDDPEIVAVVICAETNRHLDCVIPAAKAGKHMFVEKPLAGNSKDSYAMAAAIDKAGVHFTTGYFMRTNPAHLFLRDQIAKGNFGTITRARGSNCHSGSLGHWFDTEWRWMADPKIAGVGAFGDLGTHSLDILLWLLGDVASTTASVQVVTKNYGDCDESGEAIMKFKCGTVGTLAAGWVDIADPVTLEISGTEAHAVIVNGELFFRCKKVDGADGSKPWKDLPPAPPAPLHQFVNAVAGQSGMPLVKPQEAAKRVSVMEAMYKGAHSGKWVTPA